MNALQSYSSDENSEEESYHRESHNKNEGTGNGVDTTTNYDDVGMDISSDCEDSGQEREGSNHTESNSSRLSGEAGDYSSGEGRRESNSRRDNGESIRSSGDREPARHSRNEDHRSARGSRTADHYSSRDPKYKSSNRIRRSRSPHSHYSRDKRSRSRDRRSRSRERRDRRKRSRSRDRRRDYRRGGSSHYVSDSKPGLLPTPHSNQNSPSPLLSVPALPSYYNPNSVNAAKFAEAERKRKLLWGNKGSNAPPSGQDPGPSGQDPGPSGQNPGLSTSRTIPPPSGPMGNPALLGLNKSNPQGRQLNLGLGKAQFRINKDSQNKDDGNDKNKTDMSNLWSSTTFNNDQDGKMASKFKRLMGVRDGCSAESESGGNRVSGSKLTQKQESMFSDMERQYEVARQATHTHKGFGLGFTSSSYVQK